MFFERTPHSQSFVVSSQIGQVSPFDVNVVIAKEDMPKLDISEGSE